MVSCMIGLSVLKVSEAKKARDDMFIYLSL
jgi:hypothetical protein